MSDKLSAVGIHSLKELQSHNCLIVFQWLKDLYPSISYKTLSDLYCLIHKAPLNSLDDSAKQQLKLQYSGMSPHYVPLPAHEIDEYLQLAAEQATTIATEIPIGAIVVKDGEIIGCGSNRTLSSNNISLHAEIVAITAAAEKLANHRLDGCDLYVTIEPCLMCTGAIIHSRIKRLIFGAAEPQSGAIVSQYQVLQNLVVNKHTEAIGPVNNALYANQLQQFMQHRRGCLKPGL